MVNSLHLFFANMPLGVTPYSHGIHHLHMLAFYICLGITAVVSIFISYFLIKYRKRQNLGQQVSPVIALEITWVVVPLILLVIMAIPATKLLAQIDSQKPADLTIKVTGYQWRWQYQYLDQGIQFFSNLSTPLEQTLGTAPKDRWYLLEVDKPLVIPVHKKIRFLMTSNDVIHSWWVPALGIKRDAIPGFIYEAWAQVEQPGIYRGQCAELCGIHHAFMPIVVEAKTEQDYEKWLAENKVSTKMPAFTDGKSIFQNSCSPCHRLNGTGRPPYIPALQGSPLTVGAVSNHIDVVLNGRVKKGMPAFADQLTDQQIAAVITYERNSWGNNDKLKYGEQAGGVVQTEDVSRVHNNEPVHG
ncbi:MAG: cytochrome c oxidase subunit II [Proteobacteria bacterium]|nr:cytochrome c oxidase subunit II [Pseudomonadota bacterium]